jgi:hypothetical protein
MALRFIGKDPDSPEGGSPSVWDDGDSYVIQGWRVSGRGRVLPAPGRRHGRDGGRLDGRHAPAGSGPAPVRSRSVVGFQNGT